MASALEPPLKNGPLGTAEKVKWKHEHLRPSEAISVWSGANGNAPLAQPKFPNCPADSFVFRLPSTLRSFFSFSFRSWLVQVFWLCLHLKGKTQHW